MQRDVDYAKGLDYLKCIYDNMVDSMLTILVVGQDIAVKRLSKNSRQRIEELKNEVTLIAKAST